MSALKVGVAACGRCPSLQIYGCAGVPPTCRWRVLPGAPGCVLSADVQPPAARDQPAPDTTYRYPPAAGYD
jgi:hypothetical protein